MPASAIRSVASEPMMVGAQELVAVGVEDDLDHALAVADRQGLAAGRKGETPDANIAPAPAPPFSVRPTLATCGWQ